MMAENEVVAPPNHGTSLSYAELVHEVLQPLQQLSRLGSGSKLAKLRDRKADLICAFIKKWRARVGPDLFPVMRLIMPDKDRDRIYRVKEATLAKLLIRILGISSVSEDAISLTKWKQPSGDAPAGDFPACVYYVLNKRSTQTQASTMTIDEVNNKLDKLVMAHKEADQNPILQSLYETLSTLEFKWIVSIIVKSMKIGMTERAVLPLMHAEAFDLFNSTSSLSRVCWQLHDTESRSSIEQNTVRVFSAYRPKLASYNQQSFDEVIKKMHEQPFWIEEKLDGERLQLHMKHGRFRYFSRNGNESTDRYGSKIVDGIEGGAITRHVEGVLEPRVKSLILDGEIIEWDPVTLAPVRFGTLKGTADREARSENALDQSFPCYCIFDVLYLNGKCLTSHSLRARRKILESIIKPKPRRVEILAIQEASTADEIEKRLRECVASASEGLVVKNPDTVYKLNARTDDWIKVKPEYMAEFGENLDLIVLGANYGSGRRGNILSSYLCGLRCDASAGSTDPIRKFVTFCRVGGGFSAEDYRTIADRTEGKWNKFDAKRPPSHLVFRYTKSGTIIDPPDMWINPEDSLVLQLKAASAEETTTFATSVTLRFPRFERIRFDRDWTDAVSERDFRELKGKAEEKKMETHVRKKRIVSRRKVQPTILHANEELEQVSTLDCVFAGHSFFITSDSRELKLSKKELEKRVQMHGGTVVQSDGLPLEAKKLASRAKRKRSTSPALQVASSNVHCIGDTWGVKQAAIKKRGLVDIMTPRWLIDSIDAGHLLQKEARYLHFATPDTQARVKLLSDNFGDSYEEHINVERLSILLTEMEDKHVLGVNRVAPMDIAELQQELDKIAEKAGQEAWWHFAGCTVYVQEHITSRREETSLRSALSLHGASVTKDALALDITHFVIAIEGRDEIQKLRSINSLRTKVGHIVKATWVMDSIKQHTRLGESRYQV